MHKPRTPCNCTSLFPFPQKCTSTAKSTWSSPNRSLFFFASPSLTFAATIAYLAGIALSLCLKSFFLYNSVGFPQFMLIPRDLRETIESGPLCITDLFQNKSVAYFFNFFQLFKKKKKIIEAILCNFSMRLLKYF